MRLNPEESRAAPGRGWLTPLGWRQDPVGRRPCPADHSLWSFKIIFIVSFHHYKSDTWSVQKTWEGQMKKGPHFPPQKGSCCYHCAHPESPLCIYTDLWPRYCTHILFCSLPCLVFDGKKAVANLLFNFVLNLQRKAICPSCILSVTQEKCPSWGPTAELHRGTESGAGAAWESAEGAAGKGFPAQRTNQ